MCDVEYVGTFDPPITRDELCAAISRNEWKPPHLNFRQFRSIIIPSSLPERIRALRKSKTRSLVDVEQELERGVAASLNLSPDQRRQRLLSAEKHPEKMQVTTTIFHRNTDVIAEVLYRANGYCQMCQEPAPFLCKSDGAPYLEVHHQVFLKNDGEDSVENAIAVCPNCHRKAHYG